MRPGPSWRPCAWTWRSGGLRDGGSRAAGATRRSRGGWPQAAPARRTESEIWRASAASEFILHDEWVATPAMKWAPSRVGASLPPQEAKAASWGPRSLGPPESEARIGQSARRGQVSSGYQVISFASKRKCRCPKCMVRYRRNSFPARPRGSPAFSARCASRSLVLGRWAVRWRGSWWSPGRRGWS